MKLIDRLASAIRPLSALPSRLLLHELHDYPQSHSKQNARRMLYASLQVKRRIREESPQPNTEVKKK